MKQGTISHKARIYDERGLQTSKDITVSVMDDMIIIGKTPHLASDLILDLEKQEITSTGGTWSVKW